jgi:hypothetical protein
VSVEAEHALVPAGMIQTPIYSLILPVEHTKCLPDGRYTTSFLLTLDQSSENLLFAELIIYDKQASRSRKERAFP